MQLKKDTFLVKNQNSVVQSQNPSTMAVLVPNSQTEIQRLNQEAIKILNHGLAGKNMVKFY